MIKEYVLKNNVKLIYKKTTSNLTSISISLDAGAGKEKDLLGVAHATEHMVYKGTTKRSESEINRDLSKIFGFQNAMTNYPYVIFYGTSLAEDFEKAVELFSDIIINPLFKEEGFKEEMEVIKEELREWDEELEQYCEDRQFLNSFENRRIKYPIIGTRSSLDKMNLNDIKEFYCNNYLPKNTSIAVISSLEFQEVKSTIEKHFGFWDRDSFQEEMELIYGEIKENIYKDFKVGGNTSRVQICFPIEELTFEEIKALRVFNVYFGEGVNSVLFENLRTQNGLVYDVLTNIANEKYIKLYKIFFNISKENINQAIELVDKCITNIDDLFININEKDIKDFIKLLKLKRWFREEQNIILAKELSTYSTMFKDYKIYSEEFNNIENIDMEFIYHTVKKVFKRRSIQIITN